MKSYEHVPHNGVHTSIEATFNIAPKVGSIGARILAFLRERGEVGATLEEIETSTKISGNTVRPRMKTLRKHEQVMNSGLTHKTLAGNEAIIWRIDEG